MINVWVFIARLFSFLYLRLHIYRLWSNLYRFIWERSYKNVQIHKFERLALLVDFIRLQKWKADSWKEMFDAVSSPQKVQAIGQDMAGDHYIGDCDEFAVYLSNAIAEALAVGLMAEDNLQSPRFLTITWIEKKTWKATGHNVCLLAHPQAIGGTLYSYMDYGKPSVKLFSISDVVKLVRDTYAGEGQYIGLTWCAADPNLKPWITNWG